MLEQRGITKSTLSPRVESSSSKPCREEGFGNEDQDAGYQAASQIEGGRQSLTTSPSKPSPETRRLFRFRRGRHRSWPSCTAKQRALLICAPNREGSFPPRLFCPRLNRRAPAPL